MSFWQGPALSHTAGGVATMALHHRGSYGSGTMRCARSIIPLISTLSLLSALPCMAATELDRSRAGLIEALRSDFNEGASLHNRATLERYTKACRAGIQFACTHKEWRVNGKGRFGAALLRAATPTCRRGEGAACLVLGLLASKRRPGGQPVRARSSRALASRKYQLACRAGEALGCLWLSDLLELREPDSKVILLIRQAACLRGNAEGCARYGVHVSEGRGVRRDRAAALTLFIRACDKGAPLACRRAADHLLEEPKPHVAWKRALNLYGRACKDGHIPGCERAAILHRDGRASLPRLTSRVDLTRKSCAAGVARSCRELRRSGPSGWRRVTPAVARDPTERVSLQHRRRIVRRPPTESYGGWLTMGYVAAPLLLVPTEGLSIFLPATVHWVNGQGGRGMIALAGTVVAPTAGLLIWFIIAEGVADSNDAFLSLGALGAIGGYIGWAAYDVSKASGVARGPSAGLELQPYFRRAKDGMSVGLVGRF